MSEAQSDTLPPQKKRQRRDGDENERKRSQYWFEDGNVVLQAENTLFRVHKSILSRHSEIFKDTFAKPHAPSQESEHIEGCPVIPLSDTAKDMANIISLLYDNDKRLKFGSKLPAKVLGSMLRLGRKYGIGYLENEALDRLHHDYPTTLEDWKSCCDDSQQIGDGLKINTTTKIISIAHEFQLFTVLPAAYARYLQFRYLVDFLDDDSIPEKAREHCIIGNSRVVGYVKDRIVDALCPPLVIPSKTCTSTSSGKCKANGWQTIKHMPIWITRESESFGIFDCSKTNNTNHLCSHCRTEVNKLTETVRSEFWSILPTLFELPPWADLKDGR